MNFNNILSPQQGAEWPGSPHRPRGHHQARAHISCHTGGVARSQSAGQMRFQIKIKTNKYCNEAAMSVCAFFLLSRYKIIWEGKWKIPLKF